jgi:hypothetical protein
MAVLTADSHWPVLTENWHWFAASRWELPNTGLNPYILSHAGKFFQAWAASNNSISKFFSLPMLQTSWTCKRGQLTQGTQNTAGLRTVPNSGDFFLPKNRWNLYDFVWSYIGWFNFVHPFLPPLNSVCTGFFLHHSYRCLLSTLEFSQSIKHGILVQSSVGRFSNADPGLYLVLTWEPIDTFKCENPTENWPQALTWSRTGSNVYIFFWEKQTGSLIELRSGSQSSLYHLSVPLVLLLAWDCYSSPVAIIFFPLLLFFSCCYYFSHMVLLVPCDEVI